jgi:drug/metabolite transporter (DMT)-like permease
MGPRFLGISLVIASAFCFSTKAVLAKLAYAEGADAATVLALRMGAALPFFAASAYQAERGARAAMAPRDRLRVLAIGVLGYYLAAALDFAGLRYVSAGLERLVLFLYPTLVVGLNFVFHREPPPRGIGLALGLSYGGVALSASGLGVGGRGSDGLLGVGLVFGSALAYAYYLSSSQPLIARYGSARVTAHVLVIACLCVLLQFAASHPLADLAQPPRVLALSAAIGIVATVLPAFALTAGIARIGASRASVLGSVGPVVTLLLAALVLDEPVGVRDLLGCALVLAGVAHIGRPERSAATIAERTASR